MAEIKKFLSESTFNDIKSELSESVHGGSKRMYITGPYLMARNT